MTKRIIGYFFFLLLTVAVQAQDIPAASSGDIQYYVDWSCFKGKESKGILEIYLMTFADQFKTNSDTAAIDIQVSIKDNRNKSIVSEAWTTYAMVPHDSLKTQLSITDEFRKELTPGEYKAQVKMTDPLTKKSGMAEIKIFVPDFTDSAASMIKYISSDTETGKIKPNPSRRYGILNPILSVYYELYPSNSSEGNYVVKYSITNNDKKLIKKLPSATVKNSKTSIAVTHGFDVSNVPSGIYNLDVAVKDERGNDIAKISRPFEVIQIDYASLNPAISEEQAEEAGRIIKILSPEKYSVYSTLNLQGKAEYLVRYWRDLDPSPGTPENEYLSRIMQRYHYANQNFSWGKEEGWASDRGRVIIQYGNPDEIDAHHAEPETAPYEIWYYTKNKNYIFVFADMQSNGHFVLVHSNKEGEVNNIYWKNSLVK